MSPATVPAAQPDRWLQNAASLAMSALLARLDLDQGARPFFWVDFRQEPPQASHSYWDHCDIAGRFVDGLALARIMTGRADGADAEAMLREFLWTHQDAAGLFYNPEDEGAGSGETSKYTRDTGVLTKPRHVDMFCQRAPLIALCTLLASGDDTARPRLRAMASGLAGIAELSGDEARFATYRWAPVLKPEWTAGVSAPERWLGYRYALLTGLARYVELDGDSPATELALGLARYYMRHGDVPPDGRFRGNTHSGGILPTTVGIARLGLFTGDRSLADWAHRVYSWVREQTPDFGFLVDGLGLEGFFAGSSETCGIADLVHLAILMTEAGFGDYWDDVERYARNQLLENQYRDAAVLRRAFPGISDRVAAMLHGGFECAAHPNSLLVWNGAEGCCIGGGLRALYLAWRASVAEAGDETRVNMGFSRVAASVDVRGHEPWAGLIEVRARVPRTVAIRVPGHARLQDVHALLDGRPVDAGRRGRYVVFAGLQPGQVAAISYPLAQFEKSYDIAGRTYQGRWRGSTMLAIEPPGERYPIYRRNALLGDAALLSAPSTFDPAEPVPARPDLW